MRGAVKEGAVSVSFALLAPQTRVTLRAEALK